MKKDLNYFNQRKAKYETMSIIGYISSGLCFILWVPIGASTRGAAIPVLVIGFLGGGILSGYARSQFKRISNEFKTIFLPDEIQRIYPDCTYDVASGFHEEEIFKSKVLKKQDRYYSEDLMIGKYEGVSFKSADVKIQDVRSSGKSTTVVTTFLGRVYKFDFNKRFKSNILVNQPKFFDNIFGWNKIKTESVKFNSELSIFSDNEHDAFYILTPHFMERLLILDRKYQDKISFSFLNSQLYIAINTGIDTFDLKMFKPLDLTIIDVYKKQLADIKDFVHQLNLEKNIFKA